MTKSDESKYELLPTGKPHVSFSEVRDWKECSFRHKLKNIDKIGQNLPGIHMDFGTAVHSACENFIKTRVMDPKIFLLELRTLWEEHGPKVPEDYTSSQFTQFGKEGLEILKDVPSWLDEQFPGWEHVDAEHQLYEAIDEHPHAFKGFIDVIIKAPGARGKSVHWLLDWKTCSWGWSADKKNDALIKSQLVFYKNFWSKKAGVDPKDVRCGFVLLKRAAKPGKHCELVTVSVGDVTSQRTLKVLNNMINGVKRGIAIKNRNSCVFCEFKDTPFCT